MAKIEDETESTESAETVLFTPEEAAALNAGNATKSVGEYNSEVDGFYYVNGSGKLKCLLCPDGNNRYIPAGALVHVSQSTSIARDIKGFVKFTGKLSKHLKETEGVIVVGGPLNNMRRPYVPR